MSKKNIEDIYPLSPMQAGMLFHSLRAEDASMYFIQLAVTVAGELDVDAFQRAFQATVDRHPMLRTGFVWERVDEPLQVVRARAKLPFVVEDLSALDLDTRARVLAEKLAEDRRRGFDLTKAPLLRVAVYRLGEGEHHVVWSRHHLLVDGWSAPMILEEVFERYGAERAGRAARVLERRPFGEYIAWLRQQDPARAAAFWRRELGDFSTPTPFAVDHPAMPLPAGTGTTGQVWARIDAATTRRAHELVRQHKLTLNTLVQGLWALLLARYTGEADVLFGGTVSGRSAPIDGIEDMLGMFINTLPVRVRVDEDAPVAEWLAGLQTRQAEAREHEHGSLVEIQGYSAIPRGTPLFESAVVFENFPVSEALERAEAKTRIASAEVHEETGLPVMLSAWVKSGIDLRLLYDRRRFDDDVMGRMARHLTTLLEGLVGDPTRRLRDVPMLSESERAEVSALSRGGARAYPLETPLHRHFEAQVARTPDAVAVTFEGAQLTYAELDARANQLAHHLVALGVTPGALVGVAMERSLELVVSLYATLKAGAAYVPIDPSYPAARVSFFLEDAAPAVLLTQAAVAQKLPPHAVRTVSVDAAASDLAALPTTRPEVAVGPKDAAYMIYTSGSTGLPKGAVNTHEGIVNRLFWMQEAFELDGTDAVLQKTPYSFDVSVWELFWPLLVGARLVVAKPGGHKDPAYLARIVAEAGVTTMHFVPSMLRAFLEQEGLSELTSLRRVICSGEALTPDLVERHYARLGAPLHNLYGPTEAAVDVTWWAATPTVETANVPIGKPIANTTIRIVDSAFRLQPVGVPGELCIGGVQLARGYWKRPELTAERFVDDPFGAPGARLYKTGDRARWLPNGDIEYLGRIDFQVKLRGFRIELGEIEAALDRHPALTGATVLVREDVPGDPRLVAYVVPRPTLPAPSAAELRELLATSLPDYMVPSAFVFLTSMPLGSSGKVDRRALPAPEQNQRGDDGHVTPRTPIEEAVARIWADLLHLPKVGADDGFFAVGGHSLLATQVIARVRQTFGVEVDIRALFEAPTLAAFARCVEEALRGGSAEIPPLVRVSREGELPLSFAQERLWFLDQLEPGNSVYNVPAAVRLRGVLDVAALSRALSEIGRRHEVLRTTFSAVRGRPVQVIGAASPIPLPVEDLTTLHPEEQDPVIIARVRAVADVPFDLARGPLLRAKLLRLAADDHVFVMCMHHVVSDAWTLGVVVRELGTLYDAYARGTNATLPELPIQYADYAVWQRGYLSGDVLTDQLAFWKQSLAGAPDVLELPADRPRPAVQSFRGARVGFHLPKALVAALGELSRKEGVTLFMTLYAGLSMLLARLSRQDDVVIGSPIANRTHAETEGLVGFFVNTLVLRTQVNDADTFRAHLARVRSVCLGAYAHQDVPFERLVEELSVRRDMSRAPLFQVAFALQNAPVERIAMPTIAIEALPIDGSTTKFDLTLVMAEHAEGIDATFEHSTDLFERATVARWAEQLVALLEAVTKDPSKPLHQYATLREEERRRVLEDFNRTATAYPRDATIHALFDAEVTRTPDAIAVSFGAQQLTYAELQRRANRLANRLRRAGVAHETMVGLAAERSLEMVVATLAILKAGGAYVPLDADYPAERLRWMVEDSGAPVIVATTEQAARLPETAAKTITLSSNDSIDDESDELSAAPSVATSLAYVMYTSGSTGLPKGVLVTHRNVVRLVRDTGYVRLGPEQVFLQYAPIAFDASTLELWAPLLNGGRVAVAPAGKVTFTELGDTIRRQGVTSAWLTAGLFNAMIEAAPEGLASLSQLLVGGEALSVPHIEKALDQLVGTALINGYGPTEGTTFSCCYSIERVDHASIPIGPPIANTRAYVLDAHRQPLPVGVPGELYLGGDGVARGYHRREELTRERFVPDPFSADPEARLYKTGDLARWLPEGVLEYLGRLDTQVKIRGYRIELGEVEAVLGKHPSIQESACLAREDVAGDKRLVAYVVLAEGQVADALELRRFLGERVPAFMVPSAFVFLPALPLTPNGKVDRRALPAPEVGSQAEYAAPESAAEEAIAAIWRELLGVSQVGRNDDFFDMGGHSLLAARLVGEIAARTGVTIPLAALFQSRTLREIAALVEAERNAPSEEAEETGRWPALVTIQPRGKRVPFFAVSRPNINALGYVALARHMHPDQPVYGLQGQFREQDEIGPYSDAEYAVVAAEYIREMRRVQPHGPYYLGGMCEGAHIAYAISQQLEAEGEEIGMVAMLDAWPWENTHVKSLVAVHNMNMRLMRMNMLYRAGRGAELAERIKAGALRKLRGVATKTKVARIVQRSAEVPKVQPTIYEARMFPGPEFVQPTIKGRIVVFRVKRQPYWRIHDFQLGWTQRTEAGVEVHVIAGEHMTFLREPFVGVLGAKLTEVLDRLRAARAESEAGTPPKAAE